MAKHVLVGAAITINAVDLSDHVKSVAISSKKDEVDVTAMGDTSKQVALGLGEDQFSVDFLQDYAAAEVDATLWPLYSGGSSFNVSVWPSGTVTSATNPKYWSGTVVMSNYDPLSGGVGAANETTVVFKSQTAIQRATA